MENILNQILSERGLQPRPHQVRNILDYTSPDKPHVAAIATAGGKTIMTAAKFELYYRCGLIKENEKVLILPADKTILRGNFVKQFDTFFKDKPASFTYCGVEDKMDLQVAIEDGIQVIIGLPQLIKDHTKLLKNVKWLVVDEAHKWYFADTIRNIVRDITPKKGILHQFLLTGTPFKFNLHRSNYIIDYTSVKTLYSQGSIGDVNMQVLHTSLALSRMDWVSMTDNLRADKRISKKDLDKSFTEVIEELVKKLKLPLKKLSTTHNISKNAMSVFGKLQKTIIFTHGIQEANVISKYLETCGVNCITSHSKVDGEVAEDSFNSFRDDKDIKVLVSVNRGKEGFDFPELYNIIDMTYSQNFEVVMQMIGRLLRKSNDETFKVFYKVAPRNTSGYFTDWMDCLIQLFDDYWYSKFNGRNTLDIRVPNALLNRPKQPKTPTFIQDGKKKIEISSGSSLSKGTKIQVVGTDNKKVPLKDGKYKVPQPPTNDNPKPAPIEIEVKKGVITKTTAPTTRGRMIPKNLQSMGFDNSLSFMEKNDWFRLEDPLSTVATTSLNKIMLNFGFKERPFRYTDRDIKEYIESCLTHDELIKKDNLKYHHIITNKQKGCYELVINHLTIHNVPFKWLSDEDKIKKIEYDRNTCSSVNEFNKKFQKHSQYLGKLYRPKLSKEGKIKYDEFFSPLEKTKTERTFEDIIELALGCDNFKVFCEKYPIEYSYCTKAGRKWINPLRIEMEKRISGWDNGSKSPNHITSTPEGIEKVKKKYKELGNHLTKTAEFFKISLTGVRSALKK